MIHTFLFPPNWFIFNHVIGLHQTSSFSQFSNGIGIQQASPKRNHPSKTAQLHHPGSTSYNPCFGFFPPLFQPWSPHPVSARCSPRSAPVRCPRAVLPSRRRNSTRRRPFPHWTRGPSLLLEFGLGGMTRPPSSPLGREPSSRTRKENVQRWGALSFLPGLLPPPLVRGRAAPGCDSSFLSGDVLNGSHPHRSCSLTSTFWFSLPFSFGEVPPLVLNRFPPRAHLTSSFSDSNESSFFPPTI